jgi:AraC-like DNA-binding protein
MRHRLASTRHVDQSQVMRSSVGPLIGAVVNAAETLGVPRTRTLPALGIQDADLISYDVRLPRAPVAALWDEIERATGDPLIGLRMARVGAAAGFPALFQYTVRAAATVAEASRGLTGLFGLLFGEDYDAVGRRTAAGWEIGYHLPVHGEPPIPRSEECLVISFVEQCRAVAPDFHPTELCFQHAAGAPLPAWRRAVGCAVAFSAPFYGVRMTDAAFHARIPSHDPDLARLLAKLARPLIATPSAPPGPADPAIRVIRELVDRGDPVSVDAVARALHVSRRTLQRQLASARTSVRSELDRARCDTARALLRNPQSTIAEVAMRLGFADPSQFTRAVRRWTGAPPTQLRKQSE